MRRVYITKAKRYDETFKKETVKYIAEHNK